MSGKTITIMTGTGDDGMTALADGRRVPKSGRRIAAIGDVDELNSLIGLVLSAGLPEAMEQELVTIQNDLFAIGAELAGSPKKPAEEIQASRLENLAEKYDAGLSPLRGFILPGGTREGALLHCARSVCRRAERSVFALAGPEEVSEAIGRYLNRLSDLLFIYARAVNQAAGRADRPWQRK